MEIQLLIVEKRSSQHYHHYYSFELFLFISMDFHYDPFWSPRPTTISQRGEKELDGSPATFPWKNLINLVNPSWRRGTSHQQIHKTSFTFCSKHHQCHVSGQISKILWFQISIILFGTNQYLLVMKYWYWNPAQNQYNMIHYYFFIILHDIGQYMSINFAAYWNHSSPVD